VRHGSFNSTLGFHWVSIRVSNGAWIPYHITLSRISTRGLMNESGEVLCLLTLPLVYLLLRDVTAAG